MRYPPMECACSVLACSAISADATQPYSLRSARCTYTKERYWFINTHLLLHLFQIKDLAQSGGVAGGPAIFNKSDAEDERILPYLDHGIPRSSRWRQSAGKWERPRIWTVMDCSSQRWRRTAQTAQTTMSPKSHTVKCASSNVLCNYEMTKCWEELRV